MHGEMFWAIFCPVNDDMRKQMTKDKKLDFRPDEYVVYPAHGVGQIISIEEQEVAGLNLELFVVHFPPCNVHAQGQSEGKAGHVVTSCTGI